MWVRMVSGPQPGEVVLVPFSVGEVLVQDGRAVKVDGPLGSQVVTTVAVVPSGLEATVVVHPPTTEKAVAHPGRRKRGRA